jgi:hypothetical protein
MKAIYLLVFLIITKISLTDAQTRDTNFNEPLPVRPVRIQCINVLSDGKILLGCDIAFYKTAPVNNLIRLNNDYTLDNSFSFSGIKNTLKQ